MGTPQTEPGFEGTLSSQTVPKMNFPGPRFPQRSIPKNWASVEVAPHGIGVLGSLWGRISQGNCSVQGALDGSRLREARGRVGRGSQARGRLAESRESRGARQSRFSSLARGARQAPLARFAIQSVARNARETWDPWRPRHSRVATANVPPLALLSSLPFGSDIPDLPSSSQDSGDASGSHGAVGTLLTGGSWGPGGAGGSHGPDPTQGGSLGTHGHLCQLLLQHLQDHVHDVLVPGVPAGCAPRARHSRHSALPHQPPRAGGAGIAPNSRCSCVPRGAGKAEVSLDALLSLGSRLS